MLKPPSPQVRKKRRVLLFNIVQRSPLPGEPAELVFAAPDRARKVALLNGAIWNSKTWGEVRKGLPAKLYRELLAECFDLDDESYKPPRPEDPFEAPGRACDGDYPPWLQREMAKIFPRRLLKEFGTEVDTVLNGPYWSLKAADLCPILGWLKQLGFIVRDGRHLGEGFH